jgi:hypothetical protein
LDNETIADGNHFIQIKVVSINLSKFWHLENIEIIAEATYHGSGIFLTID